MPEIDLNLADEEEIAEIPGIGEDRAKAIVEFRDEHGDFESWDDLKEIPGFSQGLIDQLKEGGVIIEA